MLTKYLPGVSGTACVSWYFQKLVSSFWWYVQYYNAVFVTRQNTKPLFLLAPWAPLAEPNQKTDNKSGFFNNNLCHGRLEDLLLSRFFKLIYWLFTALYEEVARAREEIYIPIALLGTGRHWMARFIYRDIRFVTTDS